MIKTHVAIKVSPRDLPNLDKEYMFLRLVYICDKQTGIFIKGHMPRIAYRHDEFYEARTN